MVDFVIHIEPSHRFQMAIHERAQLSEKPISVNHTLHDPLWTRPIGVSIETKHTGENWADAMEPRLPMVIANQWCKWCTTGVTSYGAVRFSNN